MFSMKKDRSLFYVVGEWIGKGENEKVKYIVENTARTDLVGENNLTLLHLAAPHGNLHMMEYFINIGCEIDAKDITNYTPLMLAVRHQQWEATKFLLERNADIFANDSRGNTPLSILMRTNTPNSEILKLFFNRVKCKWADKKEFVAKLIEYGCPINKIIDLHDAEMTKIFLNTPGADAYEPNLKGCSINIAMRSIDEANMTVLLLYGGKSYGRREDFVRCFQRLLRDSYTDNSLVKASRVAVKMLVQWRLLDLGTIHFVQHIFRDEPAANLCIVLDEALVKYANSILGYNVRIHMFANRNPCVLQMIKDGEVSIYSLGKRGETALHLATQASAVEMMEYLLDCGLRPNVKNIDGQTPIFHINFSRDYSMQSIKILLEYGADLQAVDNTGKIYIDYYSSFQLGRDLTQIVIRHLAILQASGISLKESFDHHILSLDDSRDYFQSCGLKLEVMKMLKVDNSLTLFETLTENMDNLIHRAKSLDCKAIDEFYKNSDLQNPGDYYITLSRTRIHRAVTINHLRKNAVAAISDGIKG